MDMVDSGDDDAKIIAVPSDDPRFNDVLDLKDLNKHTLKEIEHFYSTYKKLQNKEVTVKGFKGAKEAMAAFDRASDLYKKSKAKKKK
jgi:inorganic pyrophosphatase